MTDQTNHGVSAAAESQVPEIEEKSISKSLSGKFGREKISYTATAATQVVDRHDDRKAVFFYVAYTKDDVDPAERPLVFAFNGGPGSSTVWLHLGLFGPKRIKFDSDDSPRAFRAASSTTSTPFWTLPTSSTWTP